MSMENSIRQALEARRQYFSLFRKMKTPQRADIDLARERYFALFQELRREGLDGKFWRTLFPNAKDQIKRMWHRS